VSTQSTGLSKHERRGRRVAAGDSAPASAFSVPQSPGIDPLSLLTKRQLAELLQINPWTIDRHRKSDPDFPAPVWISGTTPRWRRQDIESWLATRPRGGRSPDYECAPKRTASAKSRRQEARK
jgi:predicted DNA-binding transcriptional regulator AlpA